MMCLGNTAKKDTLFLDMPSGFKSYAVIDPHICCTLLKRLVCLGFFVCRVGQERDILNDS